MTMPISQIQNPHLDSSAFFFPGGSTGVLLIHGFTATPVEVRLVGQYLSERGYTISGPRLPGHGTTVEEMNHCTWRDWIDHVDRAYAELAARCERVFVGGESMGGLLTLYLGAEHPEIAGIIAYAPALRAASRRIYLALLLKYFTKALEKNRAGDDPDSIVNQRWQGYLVDPVPALTQLLALQRQVRRRLPEITQALLVFQGRLDTTLDVRGAEQVIARVKSADKELVWLNQSTHCLILDVEWEAAAEKTLAFIQRVENNATT
jgi:carboxylesterase